MRRAALVVALALAALVASSSGCASRRGVLCPVLVASPFPSGGTRETYERVAQGVRAAGYRTIHESDRFGTFTVDAHRRAGAPQATFEVQCYLDGHVTLRLSGVAPDARSGMVRVPIPLREEALELFAVIAAAGGGTAR